MSTLRYPAYRLPLVRLWLLWALLVGLHFAWRVWAMFSANPGAKVDLQAANRLLIDFGFTHLPYWLAAIIVALVLQFVLFRRWWDDALTHKGNYLSDLK